MAAVNGSGTEVSAEVLFARLQQQADAMQRTIDTQKKAIDEQNERIQGLLSPSIAGAKAEKAEKAATAEKTEETGAAEEYVPTEGEKRSLQKLKKVQKLSRKEYEVQLLAKTEKRQKEEEAVVSTLALKFAEFEGLPTEDIRNRATYDKVFAVICAILDGLLEVSSAQSVLKLLVKNKVATDEDIKYISRILIACEKAELILKSCSSEDFFKKYKMSFSYSNKDTGMFLKQQNIEGFIKIAADLEVYVHHYLNTKIKKLPDSVLQEGLAPLNRLWALAQKQADADLKSDFSSYAKDAIDVRVSITSDEHKPVVHFLQVLRKYMQPNETISKSQKMGIVRAFADHFFKDKLSETTYLLGVFVLASEAKFTPELFQYFIQAMKGVHEKSPQKMKLIDGMEIIIKNMSKVEVAVASKNLTSFAQAVKEMSEVEKRYYSLHMKHDDLEYTRMRKLYDLAEATGKTLREDGNREPLLKQFSELRLPEIQEILRYLRGKNIISDQRLESFFSLCRNSFIINNIKNYLISRNYKDSLVARGVDNEMEHKSPDYFFVKLAESELLKGESAATHYLVARGNDNVSPADKLLLEELDQELKFTRSEKHFQNVIDFEVPTAPTGVTIDSLNTLFEATVFSAAERVGLRETLVGFIRNIKARRPLEGAPEGENARRQFYESMEGPLFHVIHTLLNLPSDQGGGNNKRVEALKDLIHASQECAAMQLFTCFDLYQKIVLQIPVDAQSIVYTNLGTLRETTLRYIHPQYASDASFFIHLVKKLGEALGIPGVKRYKNFVESLYTIDFEAVRKKFMRRYTVSEIIKNCKIEFGPKGRQAARNAFQEWHCSQMPVDYDDTNATLTASFKVLDDEVTQMRASGLDEAEIKKVLKIHETTPVQVREGEILTDAIIRAKQEGRRALYLKNEVYDDINTWKMKPAAICRVLVAFDVLKLR